MKTIKALLLTLFVTASACDTLYSRDVTAVITGPATVKVGATVLLAAKLEYSDGESVAVGPSMAGAVHWTSSNTGIATVDGFGAVTGVAPGTVTITATPTATTTGTGKRIAGTHSMTVE